MIVWVETTDCANNCRACPLAKGIPFQTYYSADELSHLAAEWGPISPLLESTIHREFPDVLNRSISNESTTYLSTNGTGIVQADDPEAMFDQLRTYGYQGLYFALHGLERSHDQLVGREGAFDDILIATRRARKAHFQVHWQVFLNSQNLEDIAELSSLAEPMLGGPPYIDFLHHRIHPRLQWYESLRPSLRQIQAHLPEEIIARRWGDSLAQLTEGHWLQSWESVTGRDKFKHLFEPRSWPPQPPFSHTCIAITGTRQVYLDPQCAPPILLGELVEGRSILMERLQKLTDPIERYSESWREYLCGEDTDRLHASGWSVRHKGISSAMSADGVNLTGAGAIDFCGHF